MTRAAPVHPVGAAGLVALALTLGSGPSAWCAEAPGRNFHLDDARGNDASDGLSPQTAWRSLARANAITLQPGDRLLLRAGGRFEGQLRPTGSGAEGRPIVVDGYGPGPRPLVEGDGGEAAVRLHNQEFFEIRNLEVTNDGPAPGLRRGVLVTGENHTRAARAGPRPGTRASASAGTGSPTSARTRSPCARRWHR